MTPANFGRTCAALGLVTTLALPAASHAAPLRGLARLSASGPAASSLARIGVQLTPGGAAATATTAAGSSILLPTSSARFASTTRVELGGTITFSRKTAGRSLSVRASRLQLRLGRTRALTASVGGRRVDLFSLDLRRGDYTADGSSTIVRIEGTRAALTAASSRTIARALKLRAMPQSTYGILTVSASAPAAGDASPVSGPGTGAGTGSGAAPGTSGPTASGTGPGTSPAFVAPTPRPRPAGAVDLSRSSLRWHLRESFVRYVRSGEGVTASAGAAPGPASSDGVIYDYDFTPAGGWYDPATRTASLRFTGRLVVRYSAHGIDLRFSDPLVELDGDRSRVLATFSSATASGPAGLGEFVSLELDSAQSAGAASPSLELPTVPARVTAWANEAVLSGFYPAPDNAFGHLDLRFTRSTITPPAA